MPLASRGLQKSMFRRMRHICGLGLRLVLLSLVLSSCGQNSTTAEKAFQDIVQGEEQEGLVLRTDRSHYKVGDDLTFWVENHSDHNLWFPDDNFGVQGYIYNSADHRWEQVDLGNKIIDPRPRLVQAGHSSIDPPGWLSTEWLRETGKIRLVVKGSTVPSPTTQNGIIYAAFRDVVINPQR